MAALSFRDLNGPRKMPTYLCCVQRIKPERSSKNDGLGPFIEVVI